METDSQSLPRYSASHPAGGAARCAPSADGKVLPRRRSRGLRLMIVEDEVFVAYNMQQILQGAGHKVVGSALTAEAAIDKAGDLRPDLILMDIRLLSRRDGIDAALEIRKLYGIRCIFASAFADDETVSRARTAEPLGFVQKPVTRAALIDAVERYARLL